MRVFIKSGGFKSLGSVRALRQIFQFIDTFFQFSVPFHVAHQAAHRVRMPHLQSYGNPFKADCRPPPQQCRQHRFSPRLLSAGVPVPQSALTVQDAAHIAASGAQLPFVVLESLCGFYKWTHFKHSSSSAASSQSSTICGRGGMPKISTLRQCCCAARRSPKQAE